MRKKGGKNMKYSPEFKLQVVQDLEKSKIGYRETAKKYGIDHKMIFNWERTFLEKGIEGLTIESRGRGSKGRPPKLDSQKERDLIAENQYLKMENEYLKKLNALVQSRPQKKK